MSFDGAGGRGQGSLLGNRMPQGSPVPGKGKHKIRASGKVGVINQIACLRGFLSPSLTPHVFLQEGAHKGAGLPKGVPGLPPDLRDSSLGGAGCAHSTLDPPWGKLGDNRAVRDVCHRNAMEKQCWKYALLQELSWVGSQAPWPGPVRRPLRAKECGAGLRVGD